jgi:hemoglobin
MNREIYIPPEGPPPVHAPQLFARVGLERLQALAWAHYQRLGCSAIGQLFPPDETGLREASEKQAAFWVGVTGGPPLYMEKYGPPRMRARHLPFSIDEAARKEWMRCMREALGDGSSWGFTPDDVQQWLDWLEAFSGWMVNTRS